MEGVEATVITGVQWMRLVVESLGALIVGAGVLVTLAEAVRGWRQEHGVPFNRVRLVFARYLVLALEFQLAADILSTAISPDWDQLGKLAAIAVIRTVLNYFLTHEMKEEVAHPDLEKAAT
jgi:uncharacterized membrane protein